MLVCILRVINICKEMGLFFCTLFMLKDLEFAFIPNISDYYF
jgi:hypothetical protein